MEIAQAHGYAVHEGPLIRSDLYLADEVFMTGTAAEVTPVRAIDDHEIGPPGPVTKAIQSTFFDVVRGRDERWTRWLEYAAKAPAGS
jgi:branched-chain amino acid aminotransferase